MASKATLVSRVAIIRIGQVGTAAAYSIILASPATELLIIDVNEDLRKLRSLIFVMLATAPIVRQQYEQLLIRKRAKVIIVIITVGSKYNGGKKSHHR